MTVVESTKSMRAMSSTQCSTFHIPALVGWPNAGKASLRQRPVLASSNPQIRKQFTLIMYVMLSGQIAITALTAAAITAAILTPGWLPNEIGPSPSAPSTATLWGGRNSKQLLPVSSLPASGCFWMPGYPVNVVMMMFPVWLCTFSSFVGLSCARGWPQMRRVLLVVTTLATGIFIGLLTYLENAFPMLFIGVVLVSLVVHTFGIAVNFISCVASSLGPVKPKASKMEIMARTSCLTGTDKFICLLNDEEAAYTRASLVLAGLSWTIATIAAAVIVSAHDLDWLPFFFAAIMACPAVIYFAYGVEKQVRRCKPDEREKAMINLNVDLLFFAAGCVSVELSSIRWQELGTARPCPLEKGVFHYAMKQVASTSTQSTAVSSSCSQTAKKSVEQRVTVAV